MMRIITPLLIAPFSIRVHASATPGIDPISLSALAIPSAIEPVHGRHDIPERDRSHSNRGVTFFRGGVAALFAYRDGDPDCEDAHLGWIFCARIAFDDGGGRWRLPSQFRVEGLAAKIAPNEATVNV